MILPGIKNQGKNQIFDPGNQLKYTTGKGFSQTCCVRTKLVIKMKANHNTKYF